MIPGWGPTHQAYQLRLNEDGTGIEENSMIPDKDTSIQNEHRGCGFGMYNASAVFIRKHVARLPHICFIEKKASGFPVPGDTMEVDHPPGFSSLGTAGSGWAFPLPFHQR